MTRSPEANLQHKQNTSPDRPARRESKRASLEQKLRIDYIPGEDDKEFVYLASHDESSVSVILAGNGTKEARIKYRDAIEAIPTQAHKGMIADGLERTYQQAHELDADFKRPFTVKRTSKGALVWNGGTEEGTTGAAIVWKDGGIRLGEEDTRGIINSLIPDSKLIIADNALLNTLQSQDPAHNRLNLEGVENPSGNGETYHPHGIIVVKNNTAHKDTVADAVAARTKKRQAKIAISDHEATQSQRVTGKEIELYNNVDTFADPEEQQAYDDEKRGFFITDKRGVSIYQSELKAADDTPTSTAPGKDLEVYRAYNQGDVATEQLPTGIVDMVRLAGNVEKYTEKVATYEDIAVAALAKRMKGRLFNPFTRRSKEAATKDDLNMHLLEGFSRALDGALMKQWLAEGYSDEDAARMIYEHQQTRREARAARNHAELRKDKLGSYLDKYANMSKGKKVGVAIGAAAVIGTAGLAAGAVGGVLAVVGGAGLATAKVGKTYLQHRSKIYETTRDTTAPNPDVSVVNQDGDIIQRPQTAREQVFAGKSHDEQKREKAIKDADRNKKIAVALAAASAALIGIGVAAKVAEHSDDIKSIFSGSGDTASPEQNIDKPVDEGISTPSAEVTDKDPAPTPTPTPDPELPPQVSPVDPPVGEKQPPVVDFEFSAAAETVTSGEGWYQTFKELDIPASERAALLEKVGPELQARGLAYRMSDGTFGISRPGKLPTDVLELIKNSR